MTKKEYGWDLIEGVRIYYLKNGPIRGKRKEYILDRFADYVVEKTWKGNTRKTDRKHCKQYMIDNGIDFTAYDVHHSTKGELLLIKKEFHRSVPHFGEIYKRSLV